MIDKFSTTSSSGVNFVPDDWKGHEGLRRLGIKDLEKMMDSALKFCTLRSNKKAQEVEELIAKSDLWANSTFRYALSKEIRKALISDRKVRDLFIYGSVIEDQARLTSNINLILHVEDEKADFESWFILLGEGLLKLFRKRFNLGEGFKALLDFHVVTDEEVSRKTGYAALLTSTHSALTRLS